MALDKSLGPCLNYGVGTKHYPRIQDEARAFLYVHRVSYADFNGIPLADLDGVVIRHRCDNKRCFNPDHLLAGTHADNARDKVERGRSGVSAATIAKRVATRRSKPNGYACSQQTRGKLAQANQGKRPSESARQKMSAFQKGRPRSAETRERMRSAWVLRKAKRGAA